MALVINNTVKMEWEKSLWLQTKGRGGQEGIFVYAGQNYTTANGNVITVGFNSRSCFLFVDNYGTSDEDIWEGDEVKDFAKDNMSDFPFGYEEHITLLVEDGTFDFDDEKLAHFGLSEHKEDLIARMKDVAQYATVDGDDEI